MPKGEAEQQGIQIEGAGHRRIGEERLDFGGKAYYPGVEDVIQRLDAEVVARQEQALPSLVPERIGEDTVQVGRTVFCPLLVGMHQDLSVGLGLEAVALGLQLGAQL